MEAVLDTNLLIEVLRKRPGYLWTNKIIDLDNQGKILTYLPAIVASDLQIGGKSIENFYDFKSYVEKIGFIRCELLKPLCILGMAYSNFCVLADKDLVASAERIHSILFKKSGIEFDHKNYCQK